MGAIDGRTFKSGNSVAVRLPKAVAFPPDFEISIERRGDIVTIRPRVDPVQEKRKLLELLDALQALPKPPTIQEREPIEFPERRGL